MKVIFGRHDDRISDKPVAVGLGTFDGLHVGHMVLINTLIEEARHEGCCSLVYTFTKHPEHIFRKNLFTPLLTTVKQKVDLLAQTQLDCIYFDEFDENFSRLSPESFVKEILVERLGIKLAVAGFHYSFGYKGQGNVDLLMELGKKYGFKVIVIQPIKIDDEVVSSTSIRQIVASGEVEKVFNLLGRYYSITGEVVSGKRIGNTLGFPTANIQPEEYLILPDDGVYITRTLYEGKLYHSVTNIGKNPTLSGLEKACVETHMIDFNADIYGKNIEVFFLTRLRGEKRFNGRDELIEQVHRDILKAREFFSSKLSSEK